MFGWMLPSPTFRSSGPPSGSLGSTSGIRVTSSHSMPGVVLGSAPRDEDVLVAVLPKRLAGKAAIELLELKSGDVEESEPLVLGGPPQRARPPIVQGDVDPVRSEEHTS